ncbi:hypothetical protein ACMGD3_08805 [Lysinibacillus sphaericus]
MFRNNITKRQVKKKAEKTIKILQPPGLTGEPEGSRINEVQNFC